jgi:PAS domain-containing protein
MGLSLPAAFFLASAVVAGGVVFLLWPRRAIPGARTLALLMAAVGFWAATAGFEAAVYDAGLKVLLSKLSYLGSMSAPVLYLLFALEFTGSAAVTRRGTQVLLWLVPAAGVVLAFTNEMHGLVWSAFAPGRPGTHLLVYRHGPGYFVLIAYLYAVMAVATVVLVRQALRGRVLHRRQALAILLGMPLPWLANILYVTGTSPVPELDLAPGAFALTGLALTMGLYRLGLFDLIPIARDLVIEGMEDGVMILDGEVRVLDVNPAARRLCAGCGQLVVGRSVGEPLGGWLARLRAAGRSEAAEEVFGVSGRVIEVRAAPLRGGNPLGDGHLLVLRDITEARRSSDELARTREALAERVRLLEEALADIKRLEDLLPICSYCRRVRSDENYWQQLESYVAAHSGTRFSHGVCPECYEKYIKPELAALAARSGRERGET